MQTFIEKQNSYYQRNNYKQPTRAAASRRGVSGGAVSSAYAGSMTGLSA